MSRVSQGLAQELLEDLDSGAAEPWTEADVEEIRAAEPMAQRRRVEQRPRARLDVLEQAIYLGEEAGDRRVQASVR